MQSILEHENVVSHLDVNHDANIGARFSAIAAQHPQSIAIKSNIGSISYAELNAATEILAKKLLLLTLYKTPIVAIYANRSADLVLIILACVRANLTFAVLDSAYPAARILAMLELIQPSLIIEMETAKNALPITLSMATLTLKQNYLSTLISASVIHHQAESTHATPAKHTNSIAYLLFTSGTTGLPKCIKTSHQPLNHFVGWYIKTFKVELKAKFSMLSGLGHDPILRDIFVPLSSGGEINIPEQADITHPIKLFNWLKSSKIAYLHCTPQLLKLVAIGGNQEEMHDIAHTKKLVDLHYVFSGGDTLKSQQVKSLKILAPQSTIINFYGTSETPQAVAFFEVPNHQMLDPIPIGQAIENVTLHILSPDRYPVTDGQLGEIGIETPFLSKGYLNDAQASLSKFIRSPITGAKIYLTGDFGLRREDGTVLLQGRVDDQVKIRGFRVELNEVTTALENQQYVQSALVLPKKAESGEQYLVVYLVKAKNLKISESITNNIKHALSLSLPSYMLPQHYMWLDALPMLPNGKINRAKLPQPSTEDSTQETNINHIELPINATALALIKQWQSILGVLKIEPNQSFVSLGGDSLSFIQASLAIEKTLGWLPENWENLPLRHIAELPKKANSHTSEISPATLIRAISITCIVLYHFSSIKIASTATLFVLAGFSVGKYLLNNVLINKNVQPILNSIIKIAVPTSLFILVKSLGDADFSLLNILLIGNFFPASVNHYHNYWFIDVLVQCLALLTLLFSFSRVRSLFQKNPFHAAMGAMLVCLIVAGISSQLGYANSLEAGIPPHNRLWLIFLGLAVSQAKTFNQKLGLFFTGYLGFVWLTKWIGHDQEAYGLIEIYFMLPFLMLIFVKKLPLPKAITPIISLVAASSLFIYLTHRMFNTVLDVLMPNLPFWLKISAILMCGVISWKIWHHAFSLAIQLWKKLLKHPSKVPHQVNKFEI